MGYGLALIGAGALFVASGLYGKSILDLLTHNVHRVLDPAGGTADVGSGAAASASGDSGGAVGGNKTALTALAEVARSQFHITIREFEPYDHVDPVHVPGSYHYKGRAFDASGTVTNMSAFANYAADEYGGNLTELFWNGNRPRNIKNGKSVRPGFVTGHRDHVHVAI